MGRKCGPPLIYAYLGLYGKGVLQENPRIPRAHRHSSPMDPGWKEGTVHSRRIRRRCLSVRQCFALCRFPDLFGTALFCSKEGAAQVRLKLGLLGDDTGHNFTFTSPQPVAYTEREQFKKELTNIISRNRSAQDASKPLTSSTVTSASASAPASGAPTPRPLAIPSHPSTSRAGSVSSDRRSTPVIPGNDAASDFRLRKKVLISNLDLGSLHRDLVMSGQITEAEFWDGREVIHLMVCISFILTLHLSASSSSPGCI
jgi:hypothetical protein